MVFDNPTPSANGTMLVVLTRLALLTGETEYMGRASALAQTFGNEANRVLNGAGGYLAGMEYLINSLIILVVGHKGHAKTQELVRAFWGKPLAQRHARPDRAGRCLAGAASRRRPRHGRRSSHRLHLPGGHLLQRIHQCRRAGLGADPAAAAAHAQQQQAQAQQQPVPQQQPRF